MADSTPTTTTTTLGVEYSIDTSEFVSQLYTSIPIGAVLVAIYCVVRQISLPTWEVRRKYSEILRDEDEDDDGGDINAIAMHESKYRLPKYSATVTYPRISTGWIRWMYDVWTMPTSEFYKHAGFDALVFRLYLRCCMYTCLASLPYALCVLLPVYATGIVEYI